MIAFALAAAAIAAATVAQPAGEAELTIDGATATYDLKMCTEEADGAMPANLLIEEMALTLTVANSEQVQTINLTKDNEFWGASRLFNGESWTDQGQPSESMVLEWGETIRVEAVLTSSMADGEKSMSLTARCF